MQTSTISLSPSVPLSPLLPLSPPASLSPPVNRPGHRGPGEFERLVLPHLDAAHRLARWLVRDPSTAEDVAQDALLRAWHYFASFRGDCARAWLLRIVRNTAYSWLESRRHGLEVVIGLPLETEAGTEIDLPDPRPDPEAMLAQRQGIAALDEAIRALSPPLRECLLLREIELLPYKQIARITGVPIGTVMSRLSRARQTLREQWQNRTEAAASCTRQGRRRAMATE